MLRHLGVEEIWDVGAGAAQQGVTLKPPGVARRSGARPNTFWGLLYNLPSSVARRSIDHDGCGRITVCLFTPPMKSRGLSTKG